MSAFTLNAPAGNLPLTPCIGSVTRQLVVIFRQSYCPAAFFCEFYYGVICGDSSYHVIVDLKRQNRLKVGAKKPKLKVKMQSVIL